MASYSVSKGTTPKRKKRVAYSPAKGLVNRPKSPAKSPRKLAGQYAISSINLPGDENLHRAVARGMYYDEVVNVVGGGRNSPNKVKRGGMNYFLPSKINIPMSTSITGLVKDESGDVGLIESPSRYYSPRKAAWGTIDFDLSSVGTEGISTNILRKKTEDV